MSRNRSMARRSIIRHHAITPHRVITRHLAITPHRRVTTGLGPATVADAVGTITDVQAATGTAEAQAIGQDLPLARGQAAVLVQDGRVTPVVIRAVAGSARLPDLPAVTSAKTATLATAVTVARAAEIDSHKR